MCSPKRMAGCSTTPLTTTGTSRCASPRLTVIVAWPSLTASQLAGRRNGDDRRIGRRELRLAGEVLAAVGQLAVGSGLGDDELHTSKVAFQSDVSRSDNKRRRPVGRATVGRALSAGRCWRCIAATRRTRHNARQDLREAGRSSRKWKRPVAGGMIMARFLPECQGKVKHSLVRTDNSAARRPCGCRSGRSWPGRCCSRWAARSRRTVPC